MRVPYEVRQQVLERAGYRCEICGCEATPKNKLTMHHKRPLVYGGRTVPENLKCWCERCHKAYHKENGYPQREKKRKGRRHKMNKLYIPCTRCGNLTSIRCFNCGKPVCRDCAIYGKVPEKYGINHYCVSCTQKLGVRPVRKW